MTFLHDLGQDLRYAARVLSRNSGFTLAAILTIALGIGVNVTLFSLFNAVALKALPVAEPDQVVRLKRWFETGSTGDLQYSFSYPEFAHVRDNSEAFSVLTASSSVIPVMGSVADGSAGRAIDSERLQMQFVSPDYFSAMGIQAELGRTFLVEDRREQESSVLVLSHAFWTRRFNADPNVIGRSVAIGSAVLTVIGVTPPRFTGTGLLPQVPDFWTPVSMLPAILPGRDSMNDPKKAEFQIIGRLKPSATLRSAQSHVDTLVRRFGTSFQESDKTRTVSLERPALFGNVDDPGFRLLAVALMFAAGLLLLVACANLSNMLLARGTLRRKEVAVRYALGARRARVARQFITENVLLALAGGAGGLILANWLAGVLWLEIKQAFAGSPFDTSAVDIDLAPDLRVFGYALLLSVLAAVAFGIVPALHSTNLRTVQRFRLRSCLLAGQVVVSVLFLIGASLLGRGLLRSQAADVGYETRDVYLLKADFGSDAQTFSRTRAALRDRLGALPEIKAATFGTPPLFGTSTPVIIVNGTADRTLTSMASESYFDTMGIPLIRGRGFTRQEAETGSAGVAIISESTAHRYWPGQDPLQKSLQLVLPFQTDATTFEVVGVVKDVRFANPTRPDPVHVYLPTSAGPHSLIVRVQGDRQIALSAIRRAVERLDANLVAGLELINLEEGPLWAHKTIPRAMALFAGILGAIALSLAGIGIYGVISYLVSHRIKEIGIRVALGANPVAVLLRMIGRGLRPTAAGIIIGIGSSLFLSWLIRQRVALPGNSDFFQGIRFYDPVAFLGIALFAAAMAVLASAVPVWRALKVDPVIALRHE